MHLRGCVHKLCNKICCFAEHRPDNYIQNEEYDQEEQVDKKSSSLHNIISWYSFRHPSRSSNSMFGKYCHLVRRGSQSDKKKSVFAAKRKKKSDEDPVRDVWANKGLNVYSTRRKDSNNSLDTVYHGRNKNTSMYSNEKAERNNDKYVRNQWASRGDSSFNDYTANIASVRIQRNNKGDVVYSGYKANTRNNGPIRNQWENKGATIYTAYKDGDVGSTSAHPVQSAHSAHFAHSVRSVHSAHSAKYRGEASTKYWVRTELQYVILLPRDRSKRKPLLQPAGSSVDGDSSDSDSSFESRSRAKPASKPKRGWCCSKRQDSG